MIHAERDYVDERLCGVNDMAFEEWLSYQNQMLRYCNIYKYDKIFEKLSTVIFINTIKFLRS